MLATAEIQSALQSMSLYAGKIDGQHGPLTDDAVEALLLKERIAKSPQWSDRRQMVAAAQVLCRMRDIDVGDIDGLVGTMSRHAFEVYEARKANNWQPVAAVENWRDDEPDKPTPAPSHALPDAAAIKLRPPLHPDWPRQSRMTSFFGNVGTNQVSCMLPFPMRIAWDLDKSVRRFSCHAKTKECFEYIWAATLNHYGIDEIRRLRLDLYGGCLNVRKMRGGSSWSMHAWGTAQDVDPEHNALRWHRDKASLDNPEYDPFWAIVYATGAIGLGRERDYDWMHFQFAKL